MGRVFNLCAHCCNPCAAGKRAASCSSPGSVYDRETSCGTGFQPVCLPIDYPGPWGLRLGAIGPVFDSSRLRW